MKNQNKIWFWAETYILHVNSMHALYTYRRYAETYTLHTNSMHALYPYGHYTETYIYTQTQCMHYIHTDATLRHTLYTQTQCMHYIHTDTTLKHTSTYKLNACIIYIDDMLKHTSTHKLNACIIHIQTLHTPMYGKTKAAWQKHSFLNGSAPSGFEQRYCSKSEFLKGWFNVQKWNCCSASGQVQEYKEVVECNNNIFFLDTRFHQCGLLFWVVLKDSGGQWQKWSSKNILWNGHLTGINKWLVKGTTLKTS